MKYTGVTLSELRRDVLAGIGYTLVIFVVALMFVGLAIELGLLPTLEALLAYAPGGQAEMTLLALIAGADAAVVVAHHVVRIVTVIVGAPLVARWVDRS